jgi:hypothetical protein
VNKWNESTKPALILFACGLLAVFLTLSQARSEFQSVLPDDGSQPTPAVSKNKTNSKSINKKIEDAKAHLADLEGAIANANKMKDCDGDGQCEALEMGSRLCGGPSQYLVVSTANPRINEVRLKVNEFTKIEKELNLLDTNSGCTNAPNAPIPNCKKGQCR